MKTENRIPRAIEVGFPIVEINRLAVPERNSFKPIYQMHKWFARRASCVFRAILLGALKPAVKADGTPTDLMEEFYKDHSKDPDTKGVAVLDPFMGGGTTIVEALRLGCKVTGIDLNPVAWFIVKTETEPVDLPLLQEAFDRLAARPVVWNDGRPLRETLLDLYKCEVAPGVEADVIYTFWVKHAICTAPNCGKEVPLFTDYVIAHKAPAIRYIPDAACPHCSKLFDWELEPATLIGDPAMMVNVGRGSAGEGRPTQRWVYAAAPRTARETATVTCPHEKCGKQGTPVVESTKSKTKRVPLTVLLCPACEAVWQWRGELPEGEVACPACRNVYDPKAGNVPSKGKFRCSCGNVDPIIESIRRLSSVRRLPVRPYALQVYLPTNKENDEEQLSLLGYAPSPQPSPGGRGGHACPLPPGEGQGEGKHKSALPSELLTFIRELRHGQTDAEKLLWAALRDRRLFGLKFRRQFPVGGFVLDFYCHEHRFAAELDGGQHYSEEGKQKDVRRDNFLKSENITVQRYSNLDVLKNTEGVLQDIAEKMGVFPSPQPSPGGRGGRGFPLPPGEGQCEGSLLLPKNGKFFTRFSPSDGARLQQADTLWEREKEHLPFPKSAVPRGEKTKTHLLGHHYNFWHEIFFPRQLLALSTLLDGVLAEQDFVLHDLLLCAFSNTLEGNNQYVRNIASRKTPGGTPPAGIFARHDFHPKMTICEQNVWGTISGNNTFISRIESLENAIRFRGLWTEGNRVVDPVQLSTSTKLICESSVTAQTLPNKLVVTDPPYVGNVNYAELADFFYVWLRLGLKDRYPWFAPEFTPKTDEIVENKVRGKSNKDFFDGLSAAFAKVHETLEEDGLMVFTFHHTDEEGTVWEGLLRSLCETGFEIVAIYPIHAEREASLHLQDKENISYDLIHVCRKRRSNPETRSWAGIRQEVRKSARAELSAIEAGRYGNEPLGPQDVRLICIGKCLELYSNHYGQVIDHEGKPLRLHEALQDIGTIVDNLVTRERPLPPELEETDPVTYAWLRVLVDVRAEININDLNKSLRAMQVTTDDLKNAGLIIKGRTGRGRFFKVKQPTERLNSLKEALEAAPGSNNGQIPLFEGVSMPVARDVPLVDLVHVLIAAAWAGESVAPWLERFSHMRPKVRAALRYVRDRRTDWKEYIDRVLNLIDGAPLFDRVADKTASSAAPPRNDGKKAGE